MSYCYPCRAEYQRAWRAANPGRQRTYKQQWETAHPEEVREGKRRRYHAHLEKSREYQRERRRLKPEAFAAYAERNRAKGRELGRYDFYRHGITPEQRRGLEDAQNGVCALCDRILSEHKHIHIDHDHATGLIRGILCASCNGKLGWYENRIGAVARYLAGPHLTPAKVVKRYVRQRKARD